jgi:iron(II)-dependent oxidoreductase
MTSASPNPDELAAWVQDGCQRTLDLVADLEDAQLIGPLLPTVNPLLWEIGHLAWFQEKFVLRQACSQPPLLDFGDALYDSGAIPHDTRWRLVLPSRKETADYMGQVADLVAAEVTRPGATDVVHHFARYTVHHYDMHTEALTYTRQTLGLPAPELPGRTGDPPDAGAGSWPGDAGVPGGQYLLGALRADPFVYDNEKWAHQVSVAPFEIAHAPVTQAEFAAFVEAGGYNDARLWSDGGAWLKAARATGPLYWSGGPGEWRRQQFGTWVNLEPHRPVSHVCWWEADAFCRWAGRRLPTEAEWELAAAGNSVPRPIYPWGDTGPDPSRAVTDWSAFGSADVAACAAGDSPYGCRQMIGGVWEWTASDFTAYPNFERDAYFENSEQFFGSRKVLRGGSWATRGRLLRSTLRNYFPPDRRDITAGFRTCPDR